MTVVGYLRVIRRQWWLFTLIALLGPLTAAVVQAGQTPQYSAQAQLFVSIDGPSTVADLQSGSTFVQQRVGSYVDVVSSPEVLQPVIARLGLADDPASLAARIDSSSPTDTVLLMVRVRDSDPQRAADIANEIARVFPGYVAALETAPGEQRSPVRIVLTRPAEANATPTSPPAWLILGVGLCAGLALGLCGALLREQTNRTVRSSADLQALTGAAALSVIPFDATARTHPLVTDDDVSGRAEALRTLRTNLRFADVDHPAQVLVITSALPGEGKSTVASNLAHVLALSGTRTVLVDADLRRPTLSSYLGVSAGVGLTEALAGRHPLEDVLVELGDGLMSVLPSGAQPPNPAELLGSQAMDDLLDRLRERYDMVVLDAPPLLPVTDAAVLSTLADGAVLVARHGRTRDSALRAAQAALAAVNAKLLGTVLNAAPRRAGGPGGYGYGYGYGYGHRPTSPVIGDRSPAPARQAAAPARRPLDLTQPRELTQPLVPPPAGAPALEVSVRRYRPSPDMPTPPAGTRAAHSGALTRPERH